MDPSWRITRRRRRLIVEVLVDERFTVAEGDTMADALMDRLDPRIKGVVVNARGDHQEDFGALYEVITALARFLAETGRAVAVTFSEAEGRPASSRRPPLHPSRRSISATRSERRGISRKGDDPAPAPAPHVEPTV